MGREVADAYIEVHGDIGPFRRALERARAAMRKYLKDNEGDHEQSYSAMRRATDAAISKMQASWRRMDSTVRVVMGLIAAAGDQVAVLGSGVAAAGTAFVSSFGMAAAAIIPLFTGLVGIGTATLLAVKSFERLRETMPGIQQALAGIS